MFGAKPTGFGFGDSSNFGSNTAFAPGFGTSTAFGAQNTPTSGLFGAPATTTSGGLFGQSATFGQQSTGGFSFNSTPSTSGGLFGQQQGSSLFSQPTSNAFGAKTTLSSFGSFGTNTASTNLFNRTQPTGTIFGQTGNMFGSSTGTGTGTSTKFQPPVSQDTMVKSGITNNINTHHQCISAMKEYEDKSLEELRLEDYQAGRKGKQQQQLAQPQPQQPAQSTSLFGTPTSQAATGFGFGQNKAATTTGFGNARSNTVLFGQTRAPLTNTGLFGQQTKPLFANPSDTSNTGFSFASNQNTGSSLFGQNQQQNKGLFGNAATQSNLFGTTNTPTFGSTGFSSNQATGGLFGNKQMAFNTPSTNTGFSFGQNTGNNLFNKPATATPFPFGTTTSSSGFGTPAGTNLFGNKASFGTNNTLSQATNSFNFANTGSTGLFGNQPKQSFGFNLPGGTGTGFSSGLGAGTGFNLGGNTSTLGSNTISLSGSTSEQANLQQHLKLLTHNPYGDSSLFMNLNNSKVKTEDILKPTNPTAQKAVLSSQYKVSTRPLARAKPKSLLPLISRKKMHVFDGLDDEDDFGFNSEDFIPKRNIKKLVIKNSGSATKTTVTYSTGIKTNSGSPSIIAESFNNNREKSVLTPNDMDEDCNISGGASKNKSFTELMIDNKSPNEKELDITFSHPDSSRDNIQDSLANNNSDYEGLNAPPHPANIVLIRPGYYTVPNWNDLVDYTDENGDCFVEDFTIGREGYGSVFFPGLTNIAGINFDEIVHFRKKEVTVYPDDSTKPGIGYGLNKRAEITLDCMWPIDKTTRVSISSPERLKLMKYEQKLENTTLRLGGQFLDYRPETGSWVFEVKHFSKYGLKDDSDDEQPNDPKKSVKGIQQRNLSVQKQRVPANTSGAGATANPDINMSEGFNNGPEIEIKDAESAAKSAPQSQINEKLVTEDAAEMSDMFRLDYEVFHMDTMDNADPVEPFSHSFAVELGVKSNNMQMMKASFFSEPENDEISEKDNLQEKLLTPMIKLASLERSSGYKPYKKTPVTLSRRKELIGWSATDAPKSEVLQVMKMLPKSQQRPIVGMRLKKPLSDAKESIMYGVKSLIDFSSFMSRSFRVGWGPNWTLVHSGSSVSQVITPILGNRFSILSGTERSISLSKNYKVTIEKVDVSSYLTSNDPIVKVQHKWMLENQVVYSTLNTEHESPHFSPRDGIEALHRYAEYAEQDEKNMVSHPDHEQVHHMKTCWDLCVALWGNPMELDNHVDNQSNYDYHQARRAAFSRWLAGTEAAAITAEIERNSFESDGHLQSIMSYLSGRQVPEACTTAMNNGDNYLALLLAQAGGVNRSCKQLMELQLQNYDNFGVGTYISNERLKILGLLAGKMVFTISDQKINVCENMNWKRALGLHLWYQCGPTSVIVEAVKSYDAAQTGNGCHGKYSKPPVPPYLENKEDDLESESLNIYDTCYHLLKLYVNNAHRLEQTLSPTASTVNHLDYRLSWHLCQVLESLGYKHLSQYQKECINISFAAQLESLDLWEWAIFVLTHIKDNKRRAATIKDTLGRHISLSEDNEYLKRETFILGKLCIPAEWVHYAKAIKAQYLNNHHKEAWQFLKSKCWNKAHQVILKHIAADAIINDDHAYLEEFLENLAPAERNSEIQDWSTGGAIYLNYIKLCDTLDNFKTKDVTITQLQKIWPELTSFSSRINHLPCYNSKDKLCQSEMSKNTANILRTLSMLLHQNDVDFEFTNILATQIENLDMPEDYMMQETRELTRFYQREICG